MRFPSGNGRAPGPRFPFLRLGFLLAFTVLTGVIGLMIIERFTFLDAIYMTVITLSTVGFGEVRDLSPLGRIFVIFLILGGLGLVTYTVTALASFIAEGQFRKLLGRRQMKKEIQNIRDHYIICGHGRMGGIVTRGLLAERRNFVIVEQDPEQAERLSGEGYLVVEGDATEDEILLEAGVVRARALVAVVSSDVDNLYITLTARELARAENPGLYIMSRADDDKAAGKIRHAGADRVLSPYQIGGSHLVNALLRPKVHDFLEVLNQGEDLRLQVEELPVADGCELAGRALRDSNLRQDYDLIVIGVLRKNGRMTFNPGPDDVIAAGDTLIVLGPSGQLQSLAARMGV